MNKPDLVRQLDSILQDIIEKAYDNNWTNQEQAEKSVTAILSAIKEALPKENKISKHLPQEVTMNYAVNHLGESLAISYKTGYNQALEEVRRILE